MGSIVAGSQVALIARKRHLSSRRGYPRTVMRMSSETLARKRFGWRQHQGFVSVHEMYDDNDPEVLPADIVQG